MTIEQRLQSLPVGKFHYRLLGLVGLGWLFDAMDTGLISFVLSSIGKEWMLSSNELGWIISAGFVGMALGAVYGGKLADLYGRKTVFAWTLVIYSVMTGLCAVAPNFFILIICRVGVGIGLGAQLPVAVTLVSEYVPARVRGRFIVLLESFWALGWLLAALISYWFIPLFGWHMAFLIGALPVLYVWVVYRYLPESLLFLVRKGKWEQAREYLSKIEKELGIEVAVLEHTQTHTTSSADSVSWKTLWTGAYRKKTAMLWMIWFGIVFSYYGIFTWLPTLLVEKGFDIVKSFEYVLMMILAQLPGYFTAALCVEKWGRKITLATFVLGAAICAYFFGQSASNEEILAWGSLMSFFNLGAWGVLYTYTPELYPTDIRALGSGWAGAIGRIGGILAPLVVAMMVDVYLDYIFVMFAVVMILLVWIVGWMGEETKGKTLE
ncbi:MFS transporter [Basilea psittacipulmonis]|uniref:Major facilitator transporter n=1 Tax=Basilea psittacipulmonis DSM 24701 TaxID=1072685 RepID=A0A077DIH7_9BURK|nr:MFS transporter [Basilea psittacipulmonis]AIL32978.1 major facilitator transporter [Basilea psittacipulmonis DSM 24701]